MIRYLLDENVPYAVAHGLRQRGVEVSTAADVELRSVDDELIVEYAVTEGYVIFTQDDDFLRIHSSGVKHSGIVYSKQGKRTLSEIIQFLKLLAEILEADDKQGQLEHC